MSDENVTSPSSEAADPGELPIGQALGLAEHHLAREEIGLGISLLEAVKLRVPQMVQPWRTLARLYVSRADWADARREVRGGRAIDPFDSELARLAARVMFAERDYAGALQSFIDASLLSGHDEVLEIPSDRRFLRSLQKILGYDDDRLMAVVGVRKQALLEIRTGFAERMETFVESSLGRGQSVLSRRQDENNRREALFELSTEMRMFSVFSHISNENIYRLAQCIRDQTLADGEILWEKGEGSFDIHVVAEGQLVMTVETPFGPFEMDRIGVGEIFGEAGFIDKQKRFCQAVSVGKTRILSLDAAAIEGHVADVDHLAADLFWAFWRSLSLKLRRATDLLKTFFDDVQSSDSKRPVDREKHGRKVKVELEKKVDVLREKGLVEVELRLLATFSTEERYEEGELIFSDGEIGDKLYIVIDGAVRISKFIPGVGDEALAILQRSDFFGELALIDDEPRSADARAHTGGTTLLVVTQDSLHEILSIDPSAAHEFLQVLATMITHRLRNLSSKTVNWKHIAG